MRRNVCRIGSAAVCAALCLTLGCSCSVLPPASGKPAAPASSVPTDAHGDPLYDSSRLDDGKLRMLYGYDNSGGACTVLCGSKVLYQSFRSENVNLLQDTVTGETNYWFRTWADPDAYCGRRSGLFDKDGNEVMTFEGEQNASMQNGLLVLQEAHAVNGSYENGYDDYGTCQVIDLSTGERLPVPDGAYRCIVCGDRLVFTCYARPADLAEDAWDDEPALHSWVIIQTKDGTQTYGADATTALSLPYAPDVLTDWVELDTCHASGEPTDETLYQPVGMSIGRPAAKIENPNLFSIGEGFGFFVFFGKLNECSKGYPMVTCTSTTAPSGASGSRLPSMGLPSTATLFTPYWTAAVLSTAM